MRDLNDAIYRTLVGLGLDRAVTPWLGGRGIIVMFHRVVPAALPGPRLRNDAHEVTGEYFERVLDFLQQVFDVVPLDMLPARLREGGRRRFACLTFDDGYGDTFSVAYPVLRRWQLPFTVYVCSGYAEGTVKPWVYELEHLLLGRPDVALTHRGEDLRFGTATHAEKMRAFDSLAEMILAGSGDVLDQLLGSSPASSKPAVAMMSWQQIQELARDPLVTIGAHSHSHRMLAGMPEAEAEADMERSRRAIEEHIGKPARHFAYPYGHPGAAGPREYAMTRRLGFETGATTIQRTLSSADADHQERLPRLDVGRTRSNLSFVRAQVSGLRPALRRWVGG